MSLNNTVDALIGGSASLSQFQVIQSAATLMALIVAFHVFVARDRKSPYSAITIYSTSLVLLFAITSAIISQALSGYLPIIAKIALFSADLCLLIGVVLFFLRIMRLQARDIHLDDRMFKYSWPRQGWDYFRRKLKQRSSPKQKKDLDYDCRPLGLSGELLKSIKDIKIFSDVEIQKAIDRNRGIELSLSIVLKVDRLFDTNPTMLELVSRFLDQDCYVQYTTAIRHPAEFVNQLKHHYTEVKKKENWSSACRQLVVVDAHTPHFGFKDAIHGVRTKQIRDECLEVVTSAPTFAGIHTATAKAYNMIKGHSSGEPRKPTLVIYEGLHALSDLESCEQYRLFFRHVLPAEKLWGGMLTLVIESSIDETDFKAISDHADVVSFQPSSVMTSAPNGKPGPV